MAGLLAFSVSHSANAGTTTADFLTWERKVQNSFLRVSISMAGVITSQTNPKVAQCMDDWYFFDEDTQTKRNNEILKIMPEYKEYDPQAVILAYVENACGVFK